MKDYIYFTVSDNSSVYLCRKARIELCPGVIYRAIKEDVTPGHPSVHVLSNVDILVRVKSGREPVMKLPALVPGERVKWPQTQTPMVAQRTRPQP